MVEHYHPDKTDVCKDAVSIPGMSVTYVLSDISKSLNYIHQEAFVAYVKICRKNSSTVVIAVP